MAIASGRPMWPEGESAWTKEQADALLRLVEDMFHGRDIDALIRGFTQDCVFRFAEQPEQHGRDALRRFFTARFARQQEYRLTKTLMAADGNRLAKRIGNMNALRRRSSRPGASAT
jgi:nuclear transport factor 2 (NTF2) superfamily protein